MRNKHIVVAIAVLVMAAQVWSDASAQPVVTIGQASALQSAPKRAAKPAPVPARVELKAMYGSGLDIRVSTEVNGRLQEHLRAGETASGPGAACKVLRIDVAKRCITLSQADKSAGVCPANACWSGVDAPMKGEGRPAAGERATLLSYPPIPAAPVATQRPMPRPGDAE